MIFVGVVCSEGRPWKKKNEKKEFFRGFKKRKLYGENIFCGVENLSCALVKDSL